MLVGLGLFGLVAAGGAAGSVAATSGDAPSAATVAQAPATTTASLTLRLTGDEQREHVLGRVPGGLEVGDKTTVANATGTLSATVTVVEPSSCGDMPPRVIAGGTTAECLLVDGAEPGGEMSGTLAGDGVALSLTVSRRDAFWMAPFAWIVIGLTASVVVLLLTTRILPERIPARKLRKLLEKPEAKTVEGLPAWVDGLKGSKTSRTILRAVDDILRRGLLTATAERANLRQAVERSSLPDDHPLRRAAALEAEEQTHAALDFYTSEGKPLAAHKASRLLEQLDEAERLKKRIARTTQEVASHISESDQPDFRAKLALVGNRFSAASDKAALAEIKLHLDLIDDQVLKAATAPPPALSQVNDASAAPNGGSVAPGVAIEGLGLVVRLPDFPRLGDLADVAVVGWVSVAMVQLVVGMFAVYVTTYLPNHTFGTPLDYAGLTIAAFGSAAVAGVVSLAALWDSSAPKE